MIIVLLVVILVAAILVGFEVAFALGIVGVVYIFLVGQPELISAVPQQIYAQMNIYDLMAVPLFLIIGELMNAGGATDRLIRFSESLVGHFRGGLAYVAQVTSMLLGGLTGSSTADTAALAPILCPMMEKEGYPKELSAAVVAAAGVKGGIVPPSLMYILYGVIGGVSIYSLFMAGLFASLVILLFHAATVYVIVRRQGIVQQSSRASLGRLARDTFFATPSLIIAGIIVGAALTGKGTVEESSALATLGAFIVGLVIYRGLRIRQLYRIILEAGVMSGSVMIIVGTSGVLAYVLAWEQVPQNLMLSLQQLTTNPLLFLLIINFALFLVGIFLEPAPALLIMGPILAPMAVQFGIDPTQFGLIVCINLLLGIISPPVGMVLFVASSVTETPLERLSISILPFLAASFAGLLIVTYLPHQVVLIFTRLLGAGP